MMTSYRERARADYKSVLAKQQANTPEIKRRRLERYKQLRRQGYKGETLFKRAGMRPVVARKWAAELGFDMEGMA